VRLGGVPQRLHEHGALLVAAQVQSSGTLRVQSSLWLLCSLDIVAVQADANSRQVEDLRDMKKGPARTLKGKGSKVHPSSSGSTHGSTPSSEDSPAEDFCFKIYFCCFCTLCAGGIVTGIVFLILHFSSTETFWYSTLVTAVTSGTRSDYSVAVQDNLAASLAMRVGINASRILSLTVTDATCPGDEQLTCPSINMEIVAEDTTSHSSALNLTSSLAQAFKDAAFLLGVMPVGVTLQEAAQVCWEAWNADPRSGAERQGSLNSFQESGECPPLDGGRTVAAVK
jgi:hypothetical protein